MNKTFLVMRYEISTTLKSKSFLFVAFVLPLIGALIFAGVSLIQSGSGNAFSGLAGSSDADELHVEGYVDENGLMTAIPASVPAGILIPYASEESAHRALDAGEIAAYYIIPPDYLEQGDLIYVYPEYRIASSEGQSWAMRTAIFDNLLGNDVERIIRARQAMDVQVNALSPDEGRDDDNPLTFFIPYATMMIFYMVIMMAASMLLNSVNNEKKNRVMEVLLVSITPRQMLSGKIVGLGLLGLLQMVIWAGMGYTLLRISGRTLSLPADFMLPPSILVWGIIFFLLGYAVYASLMAGLGALVPNMKEASQAVILVIWPLIIPMFLVSVLIEKTHSPIAIGLSLFPLTAPTAMITRLAAGGVPFWQPALAAGLLLVTAILIVRSVARMFRAQTLLSGQEFSARRFFSALLGRA